MGYLIWFLCESLKLPQRLKTVKIMGKNNEAPKFLQRLEKYMPGPNSKYNKSPADFFPGFVHGFILPLSFIYSQYNTSIKLYESENVGRKYNFGFVVGLVILLKAIMGD